MSKKTVSKQAAQRQQTYISNVLEVRDLVMNFVRQMEDEGEDVPHLLDAVHHLEEEVFEVVRRKYSFENAGVRS